MNTFSEELKQARESKGITLSDISKRTRINIKYLEAIEQGSFDVLPQTYIRAFIKAYADTIDADSADIMRKYEIHVANQFPDDASVQSQIASQQQLPLSETEKILSEQHRKRMMMFRTASALVIAAAVIIYAVRYFTDAPEQPVEETSFQSVVREAERQSADSQPSAADTVRTAVVPAAAAPDTLVLRMIATDSVWISVTRDTLPTRRGYLLAGRYRTYYALRQFKISLSNAGAMRLVLNGTELSPLGPAGASVRNVTINADNLRKP